MSHPAFVSSPVLQGSVYSNCPRLKKSSIFSGARERWNTNGFFTAVVCAFALMSLGATPSKADEFVTFQIDNRNVFDTCDLEALPQGVYSLDKDFSGAKIPGRRKDDVCQVRTNDAFNALFEFCALSGTEVLAMKSPIYGCRVKPWEKGWLFTAKVSRKDDKNAGNLMCYFICKLQ